DKILPAQGLKAARHDGDLAEGVIPGHFTQRVAQQHGGPAAKFQRGRAAITGRNQLRTAHILHTGLAQLLGGFVEALWVARDQAKQDFFRQIAALGARALYLSSYGAYE